ncbi:MAG: class II glutamine amidotransferase [Myxococcales bacterium]|nr:class II glutamine amidotransferase [Myxococcales bacterium]
MCRMFGFRSAVPSRAHRSLVEAENAVSAQSVRHPDGWGIGWVTDDDAYVVKSTNAAHASQRFQRASERLMSHTFVVHVRRATVGVVDHVNAHPFRFGRWLFAHNGTVFDFERMGPWIESRIAERFQPLILGDTDSERLFYWLLTRLHEAGLDPAGRTESSADAVAVVVRTALLELDGVARALGAERPIVNVLLTDGRLLVAHRAGMPLLLSTQKRFCADFHTCPEPSKVCMEAVRPEGVPVNHLIVASERIGDAENRWEAMADGSTVWLRSDFTLALHEPPAGWEAPVLPEGYRSSG